MMTTTVALSTLLRNSNEVIDRLDEGDVLLTRRDGGALRLSKERDAGAEHEMVAAIAQLLGATALDDASVDDLATRLSVPFAWIEFLEAAERRAFVSEFLRTARACASVGRFDRLTVVVANWCETATAYSLGLQRSVDHPD